MVLQVMQTGMHEVVKIDTPAQETNSSKPVNGFTDDVSPREHQYSDNT